MKISAPRDFSTVLHRTAHPRQRITRKGDANLPASTCGLEKTARNFVAAPVEQRKGHDRSNLSRTRGAAPPAIHPFSVRLSLLPLACEVCHRRDKYSAPRLPRLPA